MYEQRIRETVGTLRIGVPIADGSLCIVPLLSTAKVAARYVLLEQAISRGTLRITEVTETGSVPYLQAVNKGPWPVLIFDGEELVGAKQNRITNATILVGVGKTVLPVSCVEQGRWSSRGRAFGSGTYASQPSLRLLKERKVREAAKAAAAAESRRPGAGRDEGLTAEAAQQRRAERYRSDQGEVWREVEKTVRTLGAHAPTRAMADSYEAGKDNLDEIIKTLAPGLVREDTVGALVFLGGQFVCLDVLRPARRFVRLSTKLLRGYALEALLQQTRVPKEFDPQASAFRLFAEILEAGVEEQQAADLGYDLRLETKRVSGSGLLWQDELIQLSVFPKVTT